MIKNKYLTTTALLLGSSLLLAACGASLPEEDPELVISKMITEAPTSYESEMTMQLSFSEPRNNQSGTISLEAKEKVSAEDLTNPQSESSLTVDADLNLLDFEYDPESGEFNEELAQLTFAAAADVMVIGKDIYGTLQQLDIGGTSTAAEEANAVLPFVVGPYEGETVKLPLRTLEQALIPLAAASGEEVPNFDELMIYNDEILQVIADSKILMVKEDLGTEKISQLGGGRVDTYHYELAINPDGFKPLLKGLNSVLELGDEEEIEAMLAEANDPTIAQAMDIVNEMFTIEVWIGGDYLPYKVEMSSDLTQLKAAFDKAEEVLGESGFSEEEERFFTEGSFEMTLSIESTPIASFTLEAPADDEVNDLGPLIEMGLSQAGGLGGGYTPTMTDEEMEAMMGDFNEEDLGLMMEELEGMEGIEGMEGLMSEEEMEAMMEDLGDLEGTEGLMELNEADLL